MPRYIDLDDLVPADITVRVRGEEYLLPGDVPVPEYLALTNLASEIADQTSEDPEASVVGLHDRLLALFRVHQPDLQELPVGPRALLPLVFRYLDAPAEQEEAEAAPPTPAAGTPTKNSGKPPRTRTTSTTSPSSKASVSST